MRKQKILLKILKQILNFKTPNLRKKNIYLKYFNLPIRIIRDDWYVNARIVEQAFVLNNIDLNPKGKRILEFGCTKSYLPIQLSSLGYEIIGVDLRSYRFSHPNFIFYQGNILDFEDNIGFDYIIAVSVLEHVGLGVYKEKKNASALNQVTTKLADLLKRNGKIIVTVPFGQKYEDNFLRSFTYDEILSLFNSSSLKITDALFYCRKKFKFWRQCDLNEASKISNSRLNRGPTGVNCVGCFIWQKNNA